MVFIALEVQGEMPITLTLPLPELNAMTYIQIQQMTALNPNCKRAYY